MKNSPAARWALASAFAATLILAGCTPGGTTSEGGGASEPAAYPTASAAAVETAMARAMNPGLDLDALAPEIKTAFESAATPLTEEQTEIWNECISAAICETGMGDKTIAVIDDVTNPVLALAYGEFLAQAIQSGQVSKITHTTANGDVNQYLTAFRQAIAQNASMIFSEMNTFGTQLGPVLQEAKAAGIPVVNGTTILPEELSENLGVEIYGSPCDMWTQAAPALTEALAAKGITNPTYAEFSGPAGNSFAASWQPCAERELTALGWEKVYTGYDVWTPQGQSQAAAALLASGKDPDVVVLDISPAQFLQAYVDSGEPLPLIYVSGSVDVNALKDFDAARAAGAEPDVWTMSSQLILFRLAAIAGLEIANGGSASSDRIEYPLNPVPFAEAIENADLNVNGNAAVGSLLTPEQQEAALKQ
jgi:ABC-type sugar transport system substrate-binding protein